MIKAGEKGLLPQTGKKNKTETNRGMAQTEQKHHWHFSAGLVCKGTSKRGVGWTQQPLSRSLRRGRETRREERQSPRGAAEDDTAQKMAKQ